MNRFIGLTTAILLCLASSAAMASTLTQTETFDNVKEAKLNFAGFDTSLGTLTGVTALLTGTATLADGSVSGNTETFNNGSETRNIFGGNVSADIEVLGLINLSDLITGASYDCETANLSENCTANYDVFSGTTGDFTAQGMALTVASFDAPLVFEFSISTFLEQQFGITKEDPTSMWHASGSLSLAYEYEPVKPVPLPATMPFLLVGLAGLGVLRARRKQAA